MSNIHNTFLYRKKKVLFSILPPDEDYNYYSNDQNDNINKDYWKHM
ncbi:MAG: hypothetical protein K6E97_09245 [Treponema sp.]|nr:hypothetical protein [Treponema sp.]